MDNFGTYSGFHGFIWREEVVDISSEDFEYEGGFLCEGVANGTLSVRGFDASSDSNKTLVDAERKVLSYGLPYLLKAVRANSTVGSIIVSYPGRNG